MVKTTIYLPDDLKSAVRRAADQQQISEAEVIRAAIAEAVRTFERPKPGGPLFDEPWGEIDWNTNDWLEGFGES